MKKILFLILIGFSSIIQAQEFPVLKGEYLGQTPPGDTAVIFAPGVISLTNRKEKSITISQDGRECFFHAWNDTVSGIFFSEYTNQTWTVPTKIFDGASPWLSLDSKKIFVIINNEIYVFERSNGGWGNAQILPEPINSTSNEGNYIETANGDIYFHSNRSGGYGGNGDIWYIPSSSNQIENLGTNINSSSTEFGPCLPPNGEYLIFSSDRPEGYSEQDLYISFKNGQDEWTAPVNMEKSGAGINKTGWKQTAPSLSPDGKYLFFCRHNLSYTEWDIYWVSTKIIEDIKRGVFNRNK